MTGDLWDVRPLPGGLGLELRGGDKPTPVIVQSSDRVRVDLVHVKTVIAAMGDAAAERQRLHKADRQPCDWWGVRAGMRWAIGLRGGATDPMIELQTPCNNGTSFDGGTDPCPAD